MWQHEVDLSSLLSLHSPLSKWAKGEYPAGRGRKEDRGYSCLGSHCLNHKKRMVVIIQKCLILLSLMLLAFKVLDQHFSPFGS